MVIGWKFLVEMNVAVCNGWNLTQFPFFCFWLWPAEMWLFQAFFVIINPKFSHSLVFIFRYVCFFRFSYKNHTEHNLKQFVSCRSLKLPEQIHRTIPLTCGTIPCMESLTLVRIQVYVCVDPQQWNHLYWFIRVAFSLICLCLVIFRSFKHEQISMVLIFSFYILIYFFRDFLHIFRRFYLFDLRHLIAAQLFSSLFSLSFVEYIYIFSSSSPFPSTVFL